MNTVQTILFIDDDGSTLELCTIICERAGLNVVTLQDPTKLPDLLPSLPKIALVIVDLQMPYVSGFDIFALLRVQPAFENVPIAVCSAHRNQIGIVKAVGFSGFIAKPIEAKRFSDQMIALIKGEPVWDWGEA